MKSLRLILALCVLAVNLIACSSDQEKIDRAVQMTLAAQQPVSVQPTEKATDSPTSTQTATKVVPKNTATPIPTSTLAPTETPAAKTFAEKLVGTWLYEYESNTGWFVFESDGVFWMGGTHDPAEYTVLDDGSVQWTWDDNGHGSLTFSFVDDNTLLEADEGIVFYRQAAIDPAKLTGTWITDNAIIEFTTPNQGVFNGASHSYEIRNSTILYLTDIEFSFPSLLSQTSDGELYLFSHTQDRSIKTIYRKHTIVIADGSRTPRGDEVLFPFHVSGERSRCGYIDRFGAVAIEPIYGYCGPFSEGLAAVTFISYGEEWGTYFGYINNAGEFVIPQNPELRSAGDFHEGLAVVETNDYLKGYIDRTGAFAIPAQFNSAADFSGGVASVQTDSGQTFIDTAGRTVPEPQHNFSEGLVGGDDGNGCYYKNTDGQIVIQTEYSGCYNFSDGLAVVSHVDDYIGFSCGYIDKQGNLAIGFQSYLCYDFSEGRAVVETMTSYLTADGYVTYLAYIDKKGKYVFNPTRLDGTGEFENGLALIRIGDQTAYIDTNGKMVYHSQDWPEVLTTGPDPISALSPDHYYSVTSTGTDFSNTDFFRHIVGMRVIWAGTIVSVASDGSVPVNVPSQSGTVQMVLHDIDQATLLRLRNNDQITFVATIADFDTGGSRRVPPISAKKAAILTINE